MKKRLFAMFLALTMALSLMPAALAAEEDQLGEPEFLAAGSTEMTGEEFLNQAQEGVISLTGDVVLTSTATITQDLTIELNDHTLSRSASNFNLLSIKSGNVTIQGNGTVSGGDFETISASTSPKDVLAVGGSANLTIDSATIQGGSVKDFQRNDKYSTLVTSGHSGNLVIKDSTISGVNVVNQSSGRIGGTAVELGWASKTSAEITKSTLTGGSSTGPSSTGGNALDLSEETTAIVTGGTITGGQGASGGHGVDVAGSITLTDVTITGGASVTSSPGVGVYCATYAENVTIVDCTVTGGSPAKGAVTNSAGHGMKIDGPVILSVKNSTIKGGDNTRESGSSGAPNGGNAIYFYSEDSVEAKIALTDVTLGTGNEAEGGNAVINGGMDGPGVKNNMANITASGTLTVENGTLKNTTITPEKGGVTIVEKNGATADVGENDLTVLGGGHVESDGQTTYYPTAAEAIESAKPGSTITVTQVGEGEKLPEPPAGATLENKTEGDIQVGDQTVSSGESLKVYVAKVGDEEFTSLPEAIQVAMKGDNKKVELLTDITVDTWTQIWHIKGITLEGNNKTLKVNAIESLDNHDAVFHSAGGNIFKNLTIDLSGIKKASEAQGLRAFSAAAGDTFTNVKIIGNDKVTYGITVSGTAAGKDETITIENCEFTNCKYGVYSDEVTNLEELTITGSKFTGCEYATILYTENAEFTNNTVTGGKLNIMSDQQTVTGNTFKDKSRIKFYKNPEVFKKNNISANSTLESDSKLTDKVQIAENYWGGNAPSSTQLNGVDVTGQDVYYEKPTMKEEDLNTYVPAPPPQPDDRPSGGSDSSSSSDGDYIVSVDTGKHGTVTVSPKRADKGDTVTITVKPDKGYELDELTVTDKNGDAVKLKDKGNGKFSFTMPGSKVTVEAKFVKESASQLPFADVSADYWAYDEIAWAYENGCMNGTSATAFNPGGNVSRQQLWMILARLSGASPASMAEAREWAIGNGISDGSNPGGAIRRQQMVATLYRYAKLMGYDTTGAADLTVFPDHASVADYAKEAMAWSVKNEIVGGTAQGTLNPAGTASRAQFAVILYRFVK